MITMLALLTLARRMNVFTLQRAVMTTTSAPKILAILLLDVLTLQLTAMMEIQTLLTDVISKQDVSTLLLIVMTRTHALMIRQLKESANIPQRPAMTEMHAPQIPVTLKLEIAFILLSRLQTLTLVLSRPAMQSRELLKQRRFVKMETNAPSTTATLRRDAK
jgi:hypothetical protein